MKASIFKVLFRSVIVVSAIVMATTVVWVATSNAGPVPDDNVCTNAGLYCNAEALCKAYIYHMECDTTTPKASATACANVLENYLAVSDKPMPSRVECPSAVPEVMNEVRNYMDCFLDMGIDLTAQIWTVNENELWYMADRGAGAIHISVHMIKNISEDIYTVQISLTDEDQLCGTGPIHFYLQTDSNTISKCIEEHTVLFQTLFGEFSP